MADLFPETVSTHAPGCDVTWESAEVNKWGHPLVTVRLLPRWDSVEGWRVGWCVIIDKVSADEWILGAATPKNWPWYRLDSQPVSGKRALACGVAARAAKIVIEQMLLYADTETCKAGRAVQESMEVQAQRWLCGVDA